jgi:hypothetical protein
MLQRIMQILVGAEKGSSDGVPDRSSLTGRSATHDGNPGIELPRSISHREGLFGHVDQRLPVKILF